MTYQSKAAVVRSFAWSMFFARLRAELHVSAETGVNVMCKCRSRCQTSACDNSCMIRVCRAWDTNYKCSDMCKQVWDQVPNKCSGKCIVKQGVKLPYNQVQKCQDRCTDKCTDKCRDLLK